MYYMSSVSLRPLSFLRDDFDFPCEVLEIVVYIACGSLSFEVSQCGNVKSLVS